MGLWRYSKGIDENDEQDKANDISSFFYKITASKKYHILLGYLDERNYSII